MIAYIEIITKIYEKIIVSDENNLSGIEGEGYEKGYFNCFIDFNVLLHGNRTYRL